MDEVVVAQHGGFGFDPAEEVLHALFEARFESWDCAGSVDFGEGEAEFVFEAPEAREQDCAGEEVGVAVGALEHDGEVVLDQARGELHGAFGDAVDGEVRGAGVEDFACEEVGEADGRAVEHGWVGLGEVCGEFFEELEGGGVDCWIWDDLDAFGGAGGEALGFGGVEAEIVVVELDPVVPVHAAEAEVDVVFGPVAEGAVGERFGVCGRPVWVRRSCWAFESAWFPGYVSVRKDSIWSGCLHLLPGGLSVGFMRFAAYVVMCVGFSRSGD